MLGVIFGIMAAALAFVAIRNPILLRMAVRNVVRRPARAVLIVSGLMLATAIISIAFTTGDSLSHSIRASITDSLRELDEYVAVDPDAEIWEGGAVPETFPESLLAEFGPALEGDPDVDSILPAYHQDVAVANPAARRFEVRAMLVGLEAERADDFEALLDLNGEAVDIQSLQANEVYLDREGAESLDTEAGDEIQVVLGENLFVPLTVRGVADGYYWSSNDAQVVVMTSLLHVQKLLEAEGELTTVLITNRGGPLTGERASVGVQERLADLPALKDNGLELVPIKSDLMEVADQGGSLFVSFFTTFGLFSIGIGLLLIFLIFSMLAAERKAEMGMARAVGMQRSQLTRLFLAEGAMYGLGSAAVGTVLGVGLGFLLIRAASQIFDVGSEGLALRIYASPLSALTAFLLGAVVTLLTVYFASRRISRLNIVRAIRDIPEPVAGAGGRKDLIWGVVLAGAGVLIILAGFASDQLPAVLFGVAMIPLGAALLMRWAGIKQRVALSLAGLALVVIFVLPDSFWNVLKDDWQDNFASFFLTGTFLVTGSVMLVMNNASIVLAAVVGTVGRYRRLTPIIKSAVAYPMRYGFRTGLSVAMFAVVIFSVVVMMVLTEGFNRLFEDQQRLAGGYDVYGFVRSDLNPIADLSSRVVDDPELALVAGASEMPQVGTFRTVGAIRGSLPDHPPADQADPYMQTTVTGVDSDFIRSNRFKIELATRDYATADGFDSRRIWEDLEANPGLAVVDSLMLNRLNTFQFALTGDQLRLDVPGLYLENETMEPVRISLQDFESGSEFEVTVIAVLDSFVSGGFLPPGMFVSSEFLSEATGRDLAPTQYFFRVEEGSGDPAGQVEVALFSHAVETLDINDTIEEFQGSQRSFFQLLMGFMLLGLVVGIAALGVISARAVVERRHAIGVMRAVGFSRTAIGMVFLFESSFIGILGIVIGLVLGIVTGVNVIESIRENEPSVQFSLPWMALALMAIAAYLCSLLTTLLPARQASRIAPAEALRYE